MSTYDKENQRQTVLHFWKQGTREAKEIHSLTNIPLRTIYYNLQKIDKYGDVKHRGGNGRHKKLTADASRTVGQYIRRDPLISAGSIAKKLTKTGINISRSTVSRHLTTNGYKNSLPLCTPMLTSSHKENRVAWAKCHINDNWNKIVFTDETAFQLFQNTIKRWHKGARPTRPIPKDRRKIFAWGGFCRKGKTSLFCFRQIMDGKFYVEILDKHIPEINKLLGKRWQFQQDNDPKHTSRIAKEFLRENVPSVLDWPSNSPDLNPIENLWGIVKREVEKRMPENFEELEKFMVEEWNAIPQSVIINLIDSMKRRCEEVIEKGGERISY